jgi:hypothetical protein
MKTGEIFPSHSRDYTFRLPVVAAGRQMSPRKCAILNSYSCFNKMKNHLNFETPSLRLAAKGLKLAANSLRLAAKGLRLTANII